MNKRQSIEAVRLVLPEFGRRKVRLMRSRDGRKNLRRRAILRAASLWLRPLNFAALVLSALVLFAGENAAAVPYILVFGVFVLVLERGAEPPLTRRRTRILRDVRPLLLNSIVEVPETKRAGRILRAQPAIEIPALPPDRPRTRVAERRPGAAEEAYE